ncbi:acyl carrier protein [Roseiarcus fermentans]|uniref:Acyl carrier protein n=1 Tax=Roseiarcus fermentans TaxID=1473586 RepID=A0A366FSP5_9HYPH|nr:acyl carrier protein [Roseiarcus fermentans]RBP17166.1 acyl carrier protein [Roseiarcus fermentans]
MTKDHSEQAPGATTESGDIRADVTRVLKDIIARRTQRDSAGWTEQTELKDTGLDSFDAIECIFELEEHYTVDIDFNANNPDTKLETIGDFIDLATRAIVAGPKG